MPGNRNSEPPAPPAQTAASVQPRVRSAAGDSDDLARDLMHRVGIAIDDWASAHGLETMPRDVVLTQVMGILSAMAEDLAPTPPPNDV